MYYSYVEIEFVATSFSPTRMDLAVKLIKHNHSLAIEPQSTQDAIQCATRILDAKYSKADLKSVVRDNCKHLSANQQKKLLLLLKDMNCSLMAP
jgi:hypothetical protein